MKTIQWIDRCITYSAVVLVHSQVSGKYSRVWVTCWRSGREPGVVAILHTKKRFTNIACVVDLVVYITFMFSLFRNETFPAKPFYIAYTYTMLMKINQIHNIQTLMN